MAMRHGSRSSIIARTQTAFLRAVYQDHAAVAAEKTLDANFVRLNFVTVAGGVPRGSCHFTNQSHAPPGLSGTALHRRRARDELEVAGAPSTRTVTEWSYPQRPSALAATEQPATSSQEMMQSGSSGYRTKTLLLHPGNRPRPGPVMAQAGASVGGALPGLPAVYDTTGRSPSFTLPCWLVNTGSPPSCETPPIL